MMKRQVTLIRDPSTNDGTFGTLVSDSGKSFISGELPWHNNKPGISCIPEGLYECRLFDSPKHGWCYQVYGVPGRDLIEIHSANFMADKPKAKQLEGCITLGKSKGMMAPSPGKPPQMALLKSRIAVDEFEEEMQGQAFDLLIINKGDV